MKRSSKRLYNLANKLIQIAGNTRIYRNAHGSSCLLCRTLIFHPVEGEHNL